MNLSGYAQGLNKINRIFGIYSMKEHLRENKFILLFSLAWLAINLIQALFTEIIEDEAYYWLYSEFPAWGYFDHPPMVAFLIKMGYSIFPNTLGVRLFPSLLGAGSIYILWFLIPELSRDRKLFLWIIPAMILMHINVAGFAALPDVPLVFFSSLYFLLLKKYLEEDRLQQAFLLGIVVALMMYSKYHALLILFFTIISFWKLLLRRSFWMIVGIAVILYLPHIFWQFKNDFASFEYHLVSRNDPFQPRQILDYIVNQLLVTGPFVGVILLYLAFSRKVSGSYERMLKFNLVGFFGFFFLSSVRGHVEPHWTAAAFPPLVVMAFVNLNGFPKLKKWLRILAIATIPGILIIRAFLIWDYLPFPDHVTHSLHGKKIWAEEIQDVAGDRPVVFMIKYQHASVYWFYTGKTAFTRNNMLYRRNQFDLWSIESELEGRPVMLTRSGPSDSTLLLHTNHGDIYYYDIDRYCSFNRLRIDILNKDLESREGMNISLQVRFSNPTEKIVDLNCDCDLPPILMYSYSQQKRKTMSNTVDPQPELGSIAPGDEIIYDITIPAPAEHGQYSLLVSFGSAILLPGINGAPVELTVFPLQETGLALQPR